MAISKWLKNFGLNIPTRPPIPGPCIIPPQVSPDSLPVPGTVIGGEYTVEDLIGSGGSAEVFRCADRSGSKKALKRFLNDKLTDSIREKIKTESSLQIDSPFVVTAESYLEECSHIFSVLPFIEGENLGNILESGSIFTEKQATFIILCLALGVYEIHEKKFIVTDIKSDNIMLASDGFLKIIDLTFLERSGFRAEASLGTLPYAAPEVSGRKRLYMSSDIFSIAVVYLELLIGRERLMEISEGWGDIFKNDMEPDISCLLPQYPKISKIIGKAMKKDPKARYERISEFLHEIISHYRTLCNDRLCLLRCGNRGIIMPENMGMVLGRESLSPDNPYISKRQFEAVYDSSQFKIRDIAGMNEFTVSGKSNPGSEWIDISDGDEIQIADLKIKVLYR